MVRWVEYLMNARIHGGGNDGETLWVTIPTNKWRERNMQEKLSF